MNVQYINRNSSCYSWAQRGLGWVGLAMGWAQQAKRWVQQVMDC
jgi:hypothetical protein